MRVRLMKEFGYEEALFGIGLSYGKVSGYATPEEAQQHDAWSRLCELAQTLALYGAGGHDKFLRQIGHHGSVVLVEADGHLQGVHRGPVRVHDAHAAEEPYHEGLLRVR